MGFDEYLTEKKGKKPSRGDIKALEEIVDMRLGDMMGAIYDELADAVEDDSVFSREDILKVIKKSL